MSESLRILLTADPMLPVPPLGYGGIERIVDALARHLQSAGHRVALVAHPDSGAAVEKLFGWPDSRVRGALPAARNTLALRRAVQEFRPNVIHSFSRLAYLAPLLSPRRPAVMSYQRPTGGRQIALAARLGGKGLCFTGCSEFICRQGRPRGGRWEAVPNFVEPDRFQFRPSVPTDAPLVFLSRLDDIKGPDLAIEIARRAGRRLVLAGNRADSGRQREFFDRTIAPRLAEPGVEWIGEIDDVRKNELLGGAAALLVPIRWDEPFGIVFVEAMACGTPVISCARGALPEIVTDGKTGFFVDGEASGAEAVRRLGEIDRAACRKTVEERFSVDVCAARYLGIYRSLTD